MRPLDAALAYAENLRWPVFPRPDGRFLKGGHGFKDATTDPVQITRWWTEYPNAWINIPTGRASGVVILDIDVKNGVNGLDTLAKLGKSQLPETPRVLTPNGGLHLYFADNPHVMIGCSVGELGPGLDVKGHGGLVPLPTTGNQYHWVETYQILKIPLRTAPGWLATRRRKSASGDGEDLAPQRILESACALIRDANPGERNEVINRQAFLIGALVKAGALKEREAMHELNAAAGTMVELTKGNKNKAKYDLNRSFDAGSTQGRWGRHR